HGQLLRLPRTACARHAAAEDRLHRVDIPVHAARRQGDGRGRRRRDPRSLRRAPECARPAWRGTDRVAELQPVPPRVGNAAAARRVAEARVGGVAVKASGERTFDAPVATVWQVLNDPAQMAKTMPGVESFDVQDERHWRANVKVPLGLGGLRMSIDFENTPERTPQFPNTPPHTHHTAPPTHTT